MLTIKNLSVSVGEKEILKDKKRQKQNVTTRVIHRVIHSIHRQKIK